MLENSMFLVAFSGILGIEHIQSIFRNNSVFTDSTYIAECFDGSMVGYPPNQETLHDC